MNIEKIKKQANEIIKNNEELNELNDFDVRYILFDKSNEKNFTVIAYNNNDMYGLNILNNNFYPIADWSYDIDTDIFEDLENNYEIGYMDMETHYNIWSYVDDMYYDMEHFDGMNKYIEYCINNNITKDIISEKIGLDVPDIMKYYKKNQGMER